MPTPHNPYKTLYEATVVYTKEELVEKLGLPPNVSFEAAWYDSICNALLVRVSGDHLPSRLPGDDPAKFSSSAFQMYTKMHALSESKE